MPIGRMFIMCVSAVIVLSGCGPNTQELRTAKQVEDFAAKVARGGKSSEWKLADAAAPEAVAAWSHRTAIADYGKTLREGADWVCDIAGKVEKLGKLDVADIFAGLTLSATDRESIFSDAQSTYQADVRDVNALIDKALELTKSELVSATSSACDASQF